MGHFKSRLADLTFSAILILFCLCLLASSSTWRSRAAGQTPAYPKQSSSAIALTADGKLLLAVNPDSNSLTVINTDQRLPLAEIIISYTPGIRALHVASFWEGKDGH